MNVSCSAEPCPVILNATCVFYEGDNLIYTGITTNDNLQTALEKIDAKFGDAAIGYIFNNGVIQTSPGQPVGLGGALVQNTTINSAGYTLYITGSIIAGAHVTTGGTASQFVKGDGSLDATSYQPAGNYITALNGDATAVGPGAVPITLKTVNLFPGTYGNATNVPIVTVNNKGLVTNVSNTPINFPNAPIIFDGDVSGSGFTSSITTLTLATVNSNVYSIITPLKFAVNGKGLVTSAAPLTNLDIFGIIGYTPVPPTRTITINGVTQNLAANRSWTISVTNGTSGTSGADGTSGVNGTSGISGSSATSGSSSSSGSSGTSSTSGSSGTSGSSSTAGSSGIDGTSGSSSTSGSSGSSSSSGSSATSGSSGSSGTSSTSGSSGSSSTAGSSGTSGSSGSSGSSATSGSSGSSGSSSTSGSSGTSGINGQSTSLYRYLAKTTATSGNPNAGYVIWDNAAQISASNLIINMTTVDSIDIDLFLSLIANGQTIVVQDQASSDNFQTWLVNATPTQTIAGGGTNNYWTIPVTYLNSGGTGSSNFANNLPIFIAIFSAQGSSGVDGTSGSSGFSGTSGSSASSGSSGSSSSSGSSGESGTSGSSASSGSSGADGTPGVIGTSGTSGSSATVAIGGTVTSGTTGSVLFINPTATLAQDNANFFWDDANNRLGIGTATPANTLDVVRGAAGAMGRGVYESASFSFNGDMKFGLYTSAAAGSGGASLLFGATNFTAGGNYPGFEFQFVPSATLASNYIRLNSVGRNATGTVVSSVADILCVFQAGNVAIGTSTNAGFKLDVNGTARVSGNSASGVLTITNQNTTSSISMASLLASGATGDTYFSVGRALTNNNSALIGHSTVGGGNYAFMAVYGRPASDFTVTSTGSIGIGTSITNTSARLQIDSTTQGLLPPRMTLAQRTAIATPAVGLVVYQTDTTEGLYQYTSAGWVNLTAAVTNRQVASYTLVLTDINKLVETNVATANNLTVPLNSTVAFPIGTKIDVVQYGAGQTTFVATVGVTIRSTNNWLKMNAQYGAATLVKIATDEWYLFGNINA